MSSSSTPDPAPHLDLEDIQQDEAEVEQEHERALGEQRGALRERGRNWVTLAWAAPGFLWLGFYLVAPLVMIVLVSFWTRTDTGFVRHWTGANYGELFHPFSLDNSYWKNMLSSFETSVIAVAACLIFGFPVAYFLAMKVQKLQYQIALFIIALAPFWTSFLTRSVAWAYPLMGREGALNQILIKAAHRLAPRRRVRLLDDVGAPGDDPALHPVHDHADLLPALAGRPACARGGARPRRQLVRAPSGR